MNIHIARAAAMVATAAALSGGAWLGTTVAHAAPVGVDAYAYENTINLTEIMDEFDTIPICAMEDGSDVIPAHGGRCVWVNDDAMWLTYADRSYLIVDDTVH